MALACLYLNWILLGSWLELDVILLVACWGLAWIIFGSCLDLAWILLLAYCLGIERDLDGSMMGG